MKAFAEPKCGVPAHLRRYCPNSDIRDRQLGHLMGSVGAAFFFWELTSVAAIFVAVFVLDADLHATAGPLQLSPTSHS
jgi:hypothetical protein